MVHIFNNLYKTKQTKLARRYILLLIRLNIPCIFNIQAVTKTPKSIATADINLLFCKCNMYAAGS